MRYKKLITAFFFIGTFLICSIANAQSGIEVIKKNFASPGDRYKPGVYWYFMDGNMSEETIKKDLDAMKKAGIANALFLEVNVGVPRGKVTFLSEEWFNLLKYAINEARKDGISITLGIGPGWQGSGGPWVKPSQSTQMLEASETVVSADQQGPVVLPLPPAPKPYFGDAGTPEMEKAREQYYQNVAVLAFPEKDNDQRLTNYSEKALFYRGPYSSDTVKPFISRPDHNELKYKAVAASNVIDLSAKMNHDGSLDWKPASGRWVVMRFIGRNNGAITRPAPVPGLGFESDKFDSTAIKMHLNNYLGNVLKNLGNEKQDNPYGLKALHMDSWEVSSQNWTPKFRQQFLKHRGYDPLKYLPVYYGHIVESAEKSERFLWDMRKTSEDLIFENHVAIIKKYAHQHGLKLSIEPYDLNQTSDLDYGSFADIPMAEFWSKGFDFNTSYSAIEAASIGHIEGKKLIQAEAFTAYKNEAWRQYPGSMKNQGDWAFATGITKFFFHTYANQFLPDSLKPGATMGPFGIHWDRGQTWWPMVGAYHSYLTRCGYLLQQGRTVADILFLTPEGNPNVFVPPASALTRDTIGDRKGFNFDGCTGRQLMQAVVVNHQIRFPSGATYKILVLPALKTMTPALLAKIETLVRMGATIVGPQPLASPSLVDYPQCDLTIRKLGNKMWKNTQGSGAMAYHRYGNGIIIFGREADELDGPLYPHYNTISAILKKLGSNEDFSADGPVRYTHRTGGNWNIYFVSNTTNKFIDFSGQFRDAKGAPELWNAVTGEVKQANHYTKTVTGTLVPLQLHAFESCFVVFSSDFNWKALPGKAIIKSDTLKDLSHDWEVSFDPKWGGPAHTTFASLQDWSLSNEEGIKYYSGTATYTKTFDFKDGAEKVGNTRVFLDLGNVKNLARVMINGKDLGVLWTAPWRADITKYLVSGGNTIKVEVVNLWANRLIGDEKLPYDGPVNDKWPEWLVDGKPRPSKRFTFTTTRQYDVDSPLQPSGLIGPVYLIKDIKLKP